MTADRAPPYETPTTLAELVCDLQKPKRRAALEEFRIEYEKLHGETDLTRRYTSTWPTDDQEWLLKHHPKRYWDGLPPFVQAFLKDIMVRAAYAGNLDDMSESLLALFIRREMNIGGNDRSR